MQHAIQAYLRATVASRPLTERAGPFLLCFDEHSDSPFRNYAVPDDGAQPTDEDGGALIDAFARRGLRARLEYLDASAPAVQPALRGHGFAVERELPLMACAAGAVRSVPIPEGVAIDVVRSDEELLALATAQNIAYEAPPAGEPDTDRLRRLVEQGGIAVLARVDGEPVGGGVCGAPVGTTTEIAGVGVTPAQRRRGIGLAVSGRLAAEAFAAGLSTPFLMAEGEAEQRIYERIGFSVIGSVLLVDGPPLRAAR